MTLTEENLMRVRDGSMTFNAFARLTRPEFIALATKVSRAYGPNLRLELDDVVQEMLIEVQKQVQRWEPSRGYALKRFVVWHACTRAREVCQVQYKLDQREPLQSQHGVTSQHVEQSALQHLEVEVVERLRDLPNGDRQVAVLNSVVDTCDVDQSLEELLRDPRTRSMFAGDRKSVRRGICRTVRELTRRAQAMG